MAAARWALLATWLDPASGILWHYQLFYYVETSEVEMFDIKNRRHFLKRVKPTPEVRAEQLFLGATVCIYGRHISIIDYCDDATKRALESETERTLAMIKPDAVARTGSILQAIHTAGFRVAAARMARLTREDAERFYAVHAGRPFFQRLIAHMTSGPVVAMMLTAPGAVAKWRAMLGPTDSAAARVDAPGSVRALFGRDGTANAAHGSDGADTAAAELDFFFGPGRGAIGRCAACTGTTLLVIKPHAVQGGAAGAVLEQLEAEPGLRVSALQQLTLSPAEAAEFLEVYKGVWAPGEWTAAVEELASGPCVAAEVAAADGGEVVERVRALCGPPDPELARLLRPKSLRARFGVSRVKNGVHCTDLSEDGGLETAYIFSLLAHADPGA